MKTFQEVKEKLQQHKVELESKYGVKGVAVFGSYVRGEQNEASDLDVLVEFKDPVGLLKFLQLERFLSELLGVKVELVTKNALKPRIGRRILQELVRV